MLIKPLKRQIVVCSFDDAIRLTGLDRGYWNGFLDSQTVAPE